jgi:hypothetical protein
VRTDILRGGGGRVCARVCVRALRAVSGTSAYLVKFGISLESSNRSSSKTVTVTTHRATVFLEQQMQYRIRRIIFTYDVVF